MPQLNPYILLAVQTLQKGSSQMGGGGGDHPNGFGGGQGNPNSGDGLTPSACTLTSHVPVGLPMISHGLRHSRAHKRYVCLGFALFL